MAKSIWVGGTLKTDILSLAGSTSSSILDMTSDNLAITVPMGNLNISSANGITMDNTTDSTGISSAGVVMSGGLSVAKRILGGDVASFAHSTSRVQFGGISNLGGTRQWFYLGRINTLAGSTGASENGVMHLSIVNPLDSTVISASGGSGGTIVFKARTFNGALVGSHSFIGLHDIVNTAGEFSQVQVFNDGANNFHAYIRAGTRTISSIIAEEYNGDILSLKSEGTGALPSGVVSGFDAWTLVYTTGSDANDVIRIGTMTIDSAVESSASTGALIVAGGISSAKTVFAGTKLSSYILDTPGSTFGLSLRVDGIQRLGMPTAGGVVGTGNFVPSNSAVYDLGAEGARWRNLLLSGTIAVASGVASTSTTSGAMIVSGGLGVGGDIYVGGSLHFGDAFVRNGYRGASVNADYVTLDTGRTSGVTWYLNDAFEVENGVTIQNGNGTSGSGNGGTPVSTAGVGLTIVSSLWQDKSTNASGTVAELHSAYIGRNTFTALNTNVTTTVASTLCIAGPPINGANETFGSTYSLYVPVGRCFIGDTVDATLTSAGALVVSGGLTVAKTLVCNKISLPVAEPGDVVDLYTAISGGQSTMTFRVGTSDTATNYDGFAFIHNVTGPGDKKLLDIRRGGVTIDTKLVLSDTMESVSGTTGSLTLAGGIGVAKNIWATEDIVSDASFVNRGTDFILGSGSNGDAGLGNSGTSRALVKSTGNKLHLNYAGDFVGGVVVGSSMVVDSTVNSTSSITGALVVSGGAAITKRLNVYDQLLVDLGTNAGVRSGGGTFAVNTSAWGIDTDVLDPNRQISLVSNNVTGGVVMTMRNLTQNIYWDLSAEAGGASRFALTAVKVSGGGTTSFVTVNGSDGGVALRGTANATSATEGGSLTIAGGLAVAKSAYFSEDVTLLRSVSGGATLTVRNTSTGVSAWSQFVLRNDTNDLAQIKYNSSTMVTDGGASAMTIVNGGGSTRIFSAGHLGMTLASSTGNASFDGTLFISSTTQSTVGGAGALVVNGGVRALKDILTSGRMVMAGATSGYVALASPAVASDTTFILPSAMPATNNSPLIVDSAGNISYGAPIPTADSPDNIVYFTYAGANNVSTPATVNGLVFSGGTFEVTVKVDITATSNVSGAYKLQGVYNGSTWKMIVQHWGDTTGVAFTINTVTGQILYTSPNTPGWTSTTFTWTDIVSSSVPVNNLTIGENIVADYVSTRGAFMTLKNAITFTDSGTALGNTLASWSAIRLNAPTLAAVNATVTTSNASTLYITDAPIAGTNQTITNAYALQVGSGVLRVDDTRQTTNVNTGALQVAGGASVTKNVHVGGNLIVDGTVTIGSGTSIDTVLHGSVVIGSQGTQFFQISVSFGVTMATTAYRLIGTVCTTAVHGMVFAVTFTGLTTTGATANVIRLDTAAGFTDTNLRLDWQLMV